MAVDQLALVRRSDVLSNLALAFLRFVGPKHSACANRRFAELEFHVPALRRAAIHGAAFLCLPAEVVAILAHAALGGLVPYHVRIDALFILAGHARA